MRVWCLPSIHLCALLGLFLACACGPAAQGGQRKNAKPSKDKAEFFGKLLGHEGKPMPMAHVTIGDEETQVASDGSFRLLVPKDAMLRAVFTGVGHEGHRAQILLAREPVEVEVRLGTYKKKEVMGEVSVVRIHFRDKGDIKQGAVHRMRKESDGIYRATVPAKAGEFAYEIRGLTAEQGRTMNGSMRTSYRYDGDGDYCNVVEATGGMLFVEHDPGLSPTPGLASKLAFAQPESITAQVSAIFDEASQAAPIASRLATIRQTRDEFLRHAQSIALFAAPLGTDSEHRSELAMLAKSTLDALPDSSLLWQAVPASLPRMLEFAGPGYNQRGLALVHHLVGQGEIDAAANLALRFLLWSAKSGDDEALRGYFNLVRSELRGTAVAKLAPIFHPDRRIRTGKFLPQFELQSADDNQTFTNASFRGKVVLIDFWATWCKPCMQELPNLHKTYAELHGAGFEILSINIDDKAGRSQAMRRRGAFPMPWKHVVAHRRDARRLKRRFEVAGLPTMILVDGKGKILATNVFARAIYWT